MLKTLAIVAAVALTGTAALARDVQVNTHNSTGTLRSTTGAGVNVQSGPTTRPPGWSEGKKTGWGCKVGSKNCVPPGQRH